jgi:thymidine kinase
MLIFTRLFNFRFSNFLNLL